MGCDHSMLFFGQMLGNVFSVTPTVRYIMQYGNYLRDFACANGTFSLKNHFKSCFRVEFFFFHNEINIINIVVVGFGFFSVCMFRASSRPTGSNMPTNWSRVIDDQVFDNRRR